MAASRSDGRQMIMSARVPPLLEIQNLCRKCQTTLIEGENWPESWVRTHNLICQPCHYKLYGGTRIGTRKRGIRHCTYCRKLDLGEHSVCKPCSKWIRDATMDWLHLQLGNKCTWCGRTSAEIELEIDHVLPVFAFRIMNRTHSANLAMNDYLAGEELRLLCIQCHKARHSL